MKRTAIGAVLLAAGRASRFGGPKQLVPMAGTPMVRHVASIAMTCADHVVVVTGAWRAEVEACLADLDIELAFNSAWQNGMGSSIACGVTRLLRIDANVHVCMMLLADQPFVTAADLAALVAAHRRHPQRIIASRYDAKTCGVPCLFPRRCFDELSSLEGPRGARSILRRHPGSVHVVPNARAGMDIDTPTDVEKWIGHGATG